MAPRRNDIASSSTDKDHDNDLPPSTVYTFRIFVAYNFVTFVDRAIIPGAVSSFAYFCANASDVATTSIHDHPDVGIGLLQASFVIGYSVSIMVIGHMIHTIHWKNVLLKSLALWMGAVVIGSGLAHLLNSFTILLLSRTMSGIAEASIQVIAPPLIQDLGQHHAGLWLGYFITAMPLGSAVGYIYGNVVANSIHWAWCYYLQALWTMPLLFLCHKHLQAPLPSSLSSSSAITATVTTTAATAATIKSEGRLPPTSSEDLSQLEGGSIHGSTNVYDDSKNRTSNSSCSRACCRTVCWEMGNEILTCLKSPVLVCIILAYASYVAVIAVLATFGGAFLLGLELFDRELTGALWFGLAAAIAGMVGTPLGGRYVDHLSTVYGDDQITVLSKTLQFVATCVLAGTLIAWPSVLCVSPHAFLAFVFGGWLCLFGAQSGILQCIMLSVPGHFRPNAIAVSTLLAHLMGDVPAPILFGAIKDYYAPACVMTNVHHGNFDNLAACRAQHVGIRKTLALAYGWLTWSVLFFVLAQWVAKSQAKRSSSTSQQQQQQQPTTASSSSIPESSVMT